MHYNMDHLILSAHSPAPLLECDKQSVLMEECPVSADGHDKKQGGHPQLHDAAELRQCHPQCHHSHVARAEPCVPRWQSASVHG